MLTLKLSPEEQVALREALDFTFAAGAVKFVDAAKPLIRIMDQLKTPEAEQFRVKMIELRNSKGKA